MIVGAVLQTIGWDYAMMLVARVVTGVGNGLLTSTVPAYQSECAKPHLRGQLVLFEGSLITFVGIGPPHQVGKTDFRVSWSPTGLTSDSTSPRAASHGASQSRSRSSLLSL